MIISSLIILSNLLFLMLFLRLWAPDWRRTLGANAYLAPIARQTERIVQFLKPAFFFLPDSLIVLASLLFLVSFRGLLFYNSSHAWRLAAGATLLLRDIATHSPVSCLLFSFISLMQFLTRIWFLAWLVEWVNGGRSRAPAAEALQWASLPVSLLPYWRRPVAMLLVNALMVMLLEGTGLPVEIVVRGETLALPMAELAWAAQPLRSVLRLALLSLGATLDGLMLAYHLLVLCLIVGLLSSLLGNIGMQARASEWTQLVMGRFGRKPVIVGDWDLTPLIFLLLLPIGYAILLNPIGVLLNLI